MFKRTLAFLFAVGLALISPASADVKPSGLPAAASAVSTDIVVGNHAGVTSSFTLGQIWSPPGPIVYQGAGVLGTAAQTWCAQDGGATAGYACNVPTGSTYGYQWLMNNVTQLATLSAAGVFTASSFTGSGAGITSGTVPNAALVTTPLNVSGTAQAKSGPLSVGSLIATSAVAGSFSGNGFTGGNLNAGLVADATSGVGDAGIVNSNNGGGFSFYQWNGASFVRVATVSAAGGIAAGSYIQAAPTINSTNTPGNVPPCYTAAGATCGSTTHIVQGTFTGTGGAITITLVGSAAFTSGTSYTVVVNNITTGVFYGNYTQNARSVLFGGTTNAQTYTYLMVGT